ncbi:signal recognition particle-docking protein FtsY [Streptococcus pseudoporcinus]|uniref:Signal recognition particle receptor FtsY n=1 Tax=Streptococcus pseudoporcinus LQ 940-04 TaxID=875093 RepID=G5KBA3_9STRE|nr:signal recognition particle-docking protein FtsY [Streptococcus pseudoporcinus]EFR44482.1 signal recognition particle-docking protein FtsY [Streptococcus pseudoporcinus SPIN 20026]EHI64483.1 signal recognition particle-docking protein FtsY [Streptococcus pseudoporcinus LQ 940-04]VEF94478.1 cell division protein [Streptococcus pseudoporcinus]
MGLFDKLFGSKKAKEKIDFPDVTEIKEAEPTNLAEDTVKDGSSVTSDQTEKPLPTRGQSQDESISLEPSEGENEIEAASARASTYSKADVESDVSSHHQDIIDPEMGNLQSQEGGALNYQSEPKENDDHQASEEKSTSYSKVDDYYRDKASLEEQARQEKLSSSEDMPIEDKQGSSQVAEDQALIEESDQEKYDRSLKKTRSGFASRLNAFFANFRRVDEEFFEELEEMLILSDVGVTVATTLTDQLRQEAKLENAKKPEVLRRVIIEKLVAIYEKDGIYGENINYQNKLTVMLFVGVNGVGKTTSIGKLAYRYKSEGKKVMLVAADTFRAGAVAQLVEWGRRVDVPVVTGSEKADPASVVFDGVEKAVAQEVDILLIDTAGRLQNKENLMAELEKMGRIIKRVIPDAPHETLLALDASTGQNALSQAKEFSKIMPLTGLILTKIDGTAKGGVVLAIRQELDIPVKFIGFGEKIDDIGEFDSEEFMKGLLGDMI